MSSARSVGENWRLWPLEKSTSARVNHRFSRRIRVDSREYGVGAQILAALDVTRVRLMTNNPAKIRGIECAGVEVTERVAAASCPSPDNIDYLRTKQRRMGHLLVEHDGT